MVGSSDWCSSELRQQSYLARDEGDKALDRPEQPRGPIVLTDLTVDRGADAEIVRVTLQVAGRRDPWSERREGVARLAAGRIETAGPARNVPHAGVVHDRIAENVIPRLVRRDVAAGTADHDRQLGLVIPDRKSTRLNSSH